MVVMPLLYWPGECHAVVKVQEVDELIRILLELDVS